MQNWYVPKLFTDCVCLVRVQRVSVHEYLVCLLPLRSCCATDEHLSASWLTTLRWRNRSLSGKPFTSDSSSREWNTDRSGTEHGECGWYRPTLGVTYYTLYIHALVIGNSQEQQWGILTSPFPPRRSEVDLLKGRGGLGLARHAHGNFNQKHNSGDICVISFLLQICTSHFPCQRVDQIYKQVRLLHGKVSRSEQKKRKWNLSARLIGENCYVQTKSKPFQNIWKWFLENIKY